MPLTDVIVRNANSNIDTYTLFVYIIDISH